jgi:penicillin-binding protein 2
MTDKIKWFKALLGLTMALIVGRLIFLQVIEADYYRVLADENRVKLEIIPANRGVIYDRHGEVLVRNAPDKREYVLGAAASHVLGYVGQVSEEEWQDCLQKANCNYLFSEVIGKLGLEKYYDEVLRGEAGSLIFEQDAQGSKIREIGRTEPVAGQSLTTTLDSSLQKKAYQLMEGKKGALIATTPNGEVLALVSSPGFDPNNVVEYLTDPDLPLFDRAIGGEYPPGSTYKVITATAALEEGKIKADTLIEDTGELRVGIYRYGNWYFDQYGQKEGYLNLVRALARSNDIFFYKLGEFLGIKHLADWSRFFGLGQVTGIDLLGESNGLMPDDDWKLNYFNQRWFLGDTYITAIGQGNILTTPLQVNQMMAVMATNGLLCRPHLTKIDPDCRSLNIAKENLDLIKEGLKQVTQTGGTAFPFFDFAVNGQAIEVAGKTGTAEFGLQTENEDADDTHAWFTVFGPVEEPQIVITILLEAAGEGSREAAPVAKDLMTSWFLRQQ